jgi:hypothetical protein
MNDAILHVRHNASGEEWIQKLKPQHVLDITKRIQYFLRTTFDGELKLDGNVASGLDGEYTATIYTDGRGPGSAVCWTTAGFWTEATY